MTALDFTPSTMAAPRSQQIWAHATTEASLILRNGEQALLALVIPIGILVAGRFFGSRFGLDFINLAPSVLALAIWSSCFTSLAATTCWNGWPPHRWASPGSYWANPQRSRSSRHFSWWFSWSLPWRSDGARVSIPWHSSWP